MLTSPPIAPMIKAMLKDRFVTIDGLRTRYWSSGNGEKIIVLVHGLGAAADIWIHNIRELARGHRVIALDLPGFGKSDIPGPSFSPSDYKDFLADFIKTTANDRVTLIGQSLGGAVVLDCTLKYPDKVDRLVLVDSAGLGREVVWTLRFLSLPFLGDLLCYPARKTVEIFFRLAVSDPSAMTEELVDTFYGYYKRPGFRRFFLTFLRKIIDWRGAREDRFIRIYASLHEITKPALIVWGEKDRVLPLKQAHAAQSLLARADLKIMKGCGHLPFLEQADEFNRLVLEFLKQG